MSRVSRGRARRPVQALALGLVLALAASHGVARADILDQAYAAGSEAAAAGDWEAAIEHWTEAAEYLPGRSAQLDYDLGTAHAQLGELGPATYYFERALQPEARPSSELAKLARRNLSVVRRQAEVEAEVEGRQVAWREGWWNLVVEILAGQAVAWVALVSAWLVVLGVGARAWLRRGEGGASTPRARTLGAASIAFAVLAALGGILHGLAYDAVHGTPEAITLEAGTQLRERPGAHLPLAFAVQGGSRVRVLEERSGWVRLRLPSGLEGWTRRESVARLDQPWVRTPVRAEADAETPPAGSR